MYVCIYYTHIYYTLVLDIGIYLVYTCIHVVCASALHVNAHVYACEHSLWSFMSHSLFCVC